MTKYIILKIKFKRFIRTKYITFRIKIYKLEKQKINLLLINFPLIIIFMSLKDFSIGSKLGGFIIII